MLPPWKESYDKPRQCIKRQRHHFANKGLHSQSYGFSNSHVWVWELDHKEGWALKNWCFQIVALEKTPESLLGSKEIKPVNPKGYQSWIFIGMTEAETETLILRLLDSKSVRKHLTGGFLCAVLDLSWIFCSLLIPEYSGIKWRGKPFPGLRNPGISFISFSIRW